MTLIDICVKTSNASAIRENIALFRNICQHTSMTLLESVFKHLIKENNRILQHIEQAEGIEKLTRLLSDGDQSPDAGKQVIQESDATPEELILLANCDLEELMEKQRILPKIQFFIEVSRSILDVIRQNCKLLHLYNQVAISLFQFAEKFNSRREYVRLSDLLHSHFSAIQRSHKTRDQALNKIPHPVRLNDSETVIKLLELRHMHLEQALKMKEWSDGYRTCDTIYTLMNKQGQTQIKGHLQNFFRHLVQIFWKSNNLLFHSFALQNLLSINRQNLKMTNEDKLSLASEFVFATLSVPLSQKLAATHERISSDYLPKDIQDELDMQQIVSQEINKVSQMLQIKGIPTRQSLITQITTQATHIVSNNPEVKTLFELIEVEESPFRMSKEGSATIASALQKNPALAKYETGIKKSLAIRILQKSKNFYTNVRF